MPTQAAGLDNIMLKVEALYWFKFNYTGSAWTTSSVLAAWNVGNPLFVFQDLNSEVSIFNILFILILSFSIINLINSSRNSQIQERANASLNFDLVSHQLSNFKSQDKPREISTKGPQKSRQI